MLKPTLMCRENNLFLWQICGYGNHIAIVFIYCTFNISPV